MAHHKDALKRIRQTAKRTERNKAVRTFYRNRIKGVRTALEAKDPAAAATALKKALSAIDQAVSKSVLHKNTGSRYKSRLTRAVNALSGSGPAAQA